MSLLPITVASWDYDRVRPLMDGRVKIEGCELRHLNLAPEECFRRAWAGEFDIAELGLITYLTSICRGEPPYIAVPVFLSRAFRHSAIYIRKDRGIEGAGDLKNKRVGVPQYDMAVAVWVRCFLQDDHGIGVSDIEWQQGGLEVPGWRSTYTLRSIPGLSIRDIPEGSTLSRMLAKGDLDAVITARAPSCFDREEPQIGRLYSDYRAVESDYFRRTGVFPIMHVLGIRRELVERYPWLPVSVFKGFDAAKRLAQADIREVTALKITLPWVTAELQSTECLMGSDYWPYGIERNLMTLRKATQAAFEQGITDREIAVEEMFAPTTLRSLKI
jgi:4,5-dihydroxyphthalate decarboxylase